VALWMTFQPLHDLMKTARRGVGARGPWAGSHYAIVERVLCHVLGYGPRLEPYQATQFTA
jgi:hypothetical protein